MNIHIGPNKYMLYHSGKPLSKNIIKTKALHK